MFEKLEKILKFLFRRVKYCARVTQLFFENFENCGRPNQYPLMTMQSGIQDGVRITTPKLIILVHSGID